MKSGIYLITNCINGHRYVGQSRNIKKRWQQHKLSATKVKSHYTTLQKAFHKYGISSFVFEVLLYCPVEDLDEKEMFYIAKLKPEYNMNSGGAGNNDYIVRDETKEVLRNKGREQWAAYDEQTKQKIISNQLTGPRKGTHRSEETKAILSDKSKAYFERIGGMPEVHKQKISQALKGKPRPNYDHYKPVNAISRDGEVLSFGSIKEAAETLNIEKTSISHCLKGNRKTAGGYRWEYCSQETIRKE